MTRLEKEVNSLPVKSVFYVNAVNCSIKEIEFLRTEIRAGRVFPDPQNFEMFSRKADVWAAVAAGETIAPQGEYMILKK